MKFKHSASFAAVGVLAMTLTACSGGNDSGDDAAAGGDGAVSGDITVLTNRTDLIDTTFQDYKEQFESEYPDVNVEFEGITDYEGDVSIRLNTKDFGDVLLIPNTVSKDQLPNFFAPLGSVDEVSETYRFVPEQSYEDQAYGVAITGNAQGYVVNTKVWEEAGITEPPTTADEFIDDLQSISDSTDATPYYTNYADGWPLSQWQGNRGVIAGPDTEQILADTDAPWTEGEEQYAIDSLLYDVVGAGLSEEDPTTTNWEESKNLLGSGEVASMVLGSWAVTQVQAAADASGGSADDIAYWPMPFQVDGAFRSTVSGDYKNAVSKYSENPEAARAWIDWFAQDSGYAASEGGLAPTVEGELPATLSEFEPLGVEFVEISPAPAGEETTLSDIYETAEIDLWGNVYRQKLIDTARGAADGDKDSYFASLNDRWSAARADVSS